MTHFRKIIHIDMDAFFASVEQRDHPEYRGKPLVVGSAKARGVVAAASYEARKYGIRSAMSSQKAAQLCPDLIFAQGRMEVYKAVSRELHAIFSEYTDLIEPISLDEAFLDVTENKRGMGLAQEMAMEIKQEIKSRLQLTASAGVSYNKFLAKIASDMQKPDGLTVIHPEKAASIIATLPIEAFWGVGKVTAKKMHTLGIHHGSDLLSMGAETLTAHFGKLGVTLAGFAQGEDHRRVTPHRQRKSVGCEQTYQEDLRDKAVIVEKLGALSQELERRVARAQFSGSTLVLKIKQHDFKLFTRSITVGQPLYDADLFFSFAKQLFVEFHFPDLRIRLLGLSVTNPSREKKELPHRQLTIPFE